MKIKIDKESLVNIEAFHGGFDEFSLFIELIECAPTLEQLKATAPDDVEITGKGTFVMVIKANYQHALGSISGEINDQNEVLLTFQAYE